MSEPTHPLVPQPCTLVIFGGSGDLARRKLIPAVYNLVLDGVLPPNYAILGNARKPLSDADFRQIARERIVKYSRQKISEKVWPDFERRLFYVAGSIEDPKAYKDLRTRLEQIEADLKLPGNRIFYLAIPPTSIADVVEGLETPVWPNHRAARDPSRGSSWRSRSGTTWIPPGRSTRPCRGSSMNPRSSASTIISAKKPSKIY